MTGSVGDGDADSELVLELSLLLLLWFDWLAGGDSGVVEYPNVMSR